MCGKKNAPSHADAEHAPANRSADAENGGFPETRIDVIAQAAEGNWDPFLKRYLRPCWREVVFTCRAHGVSIDDAEEVFQQVMLQIIKRGGLRTDMRQWMAERGESPDFTANLPGRYLKVQQVHPKVSRFRSYLYGAIRNLVCEAIRAAARRPKQLSQTQWNAVEPFVEESVSRSLQRAWLGQCLEEAARQLQAASDRARTRGRRRLFHILCLSAVAGRSTKDIAIELGIDRTTVSGLLNEARGRFAAYLGQITAVDDPEELKGLLNEDPEQLTAALSRVYHSSGACRKG